MSLIIKLAEYGNSGTDGRDKITLKIEKETTIAGRLPIAVPVASGAVVGVDIGRILTKISLEGIVDVLDLQTSTPITEIFVDTVGGGTPFIAGEELSAAVAWNGLTTPNRTNTPHCHIVSGLPNLTAPTSLFVNNWDVTGSSVENLFVVDNETLTTTRGAGEATCKVNEAFPSKRRLEQIAKNFYSSGVQTLTTRNGSYSVQIVNFNFDVIAGLEDRYILRADFVQVA